MFGIGGAVRPCWCHLLLRVACLCCCCVALWFVYVGRCAVLPGVVCLVLSLCVDCCLLCGVLSRLCYVEVCCMLLIVVVVE